MKTPSTFRRLVWAPAVALLAVLALPAAQPPAPTLAQTKAAAEAGDPIAQDKLGDACGYTTPQAETWYRQAAAKGVVNSQYRLGALLLHRAEALGANAAAKATNGDEAVKWLALAANQGDHRAQLDLGRVLREGKFAQQDPIEAYKWSALAAQGGSLETSTVGGASQRDALILKMSTADLTEAQKRVAAFTPHRPVASELPEPAFLREIKLKGLSGPPNRRLAIINDQTFEVGEQRKVKAGPRTVSVRCLEILDKSVRITIEGTPGARELAL